MLEQVPEPADAPGVPEVPVMPEAPEALEPVDVDADPETAEDTPMRAYLRLVNQRLMEEMGSQSECTDKWLTKLGGEGPRQAPGACRGRAGNGRRHRA